MYWVYGGRNSPNTKISVNLIEEFRIDYKYVDVDSDDIARNYISQYGHTEPPVVFWNSTYVGGWLELKEDILKRVNQ